MTNLEKLECSEKKMFFKLCNLVYYYFAVWNVRNGEIHSSVPQHDMQSFQKSFSKVSEKL